MITKLPNRLINQIAAGEVVERPASALKELVENSIDAGAKKIEIKVVDGGKSLISVKDDGSGIRKDDLPLAIERFATSKLDDDNLFNIHTFGFRGEALASICSIARMSIKSCARDANEAYELIYEEEGYYISPTTGKNGTTIEVRDLFYATPARLKFLKSTNSEADACYNAICNIALSTPGVAFKYFENGKIKVDIAATTDLKIRTADVLGDEFAQNTKYVEYHEVDTKIYGFISVPNYNKSTSTKQWLFVNGRPIKDKMLAAAVKNAYKSVIPVGQYPVFLLYIDIPADAVDVNVHPAKTEVRFRDSQQLASMIYRLITDNLSERLGQQASTALSRMGLHGFAKQQSACKQIINEEYYAIPVSSSKNVNKNFEFEPMDIPNAFSNFKPDLKPENSNIATLKNEHIECEYGTAIAQIDATYIVAQNGSELIIVDQHAVCERITLEKLLNKERIESQQLLTPEIISINKSLVDVAEEQFEMLSIFGIDIEKIAADEICIRGIPVIFNGCDAKKLVTDILEELNSVQNMESFENKVRHVYATTACHRSVRAGKVLSISEMNNLLIQMQHTKNIAQCCHGRPSYVKFSANDLKKMFER